VFFQRIPVQVMTHNAHGFGCFQQTGSNHEVTIVLFSRIYYIAASMEQFPEVMRECLLTDYRGRIYEDFYRYLRL
jgi:hypothetical protein